MTKETVVKRTLYDCSHARVKGDIVYCDKGVNLCGRSRDGNFNIRVVKKGKPLAVKVCQNCPRFDSMGPPIPEKEKGWQE